ncbi:ComEC/Rec2 family competence protein [Cellulomonas iranensis]|uniref:ComEC/Rec2 family competence protein n=1 Tax=Cellulomonas iranensis TaxID=76862 RepID=UPI003D7D8753
MSASPSAATTAADLRLVPPAVAAWGAALVVTLAPGVLRPAATGAGWLLAAAAAAVLAAAAGRVAGASSARWRRATAPAPRSAGRGLPGRVARVAALALATAAAVLVAGGAQRAAAEPDVLAAAAARGDAVELVGRVGADARAVTAGSAPRERVTVAATAVRVDGAWRAVAAPVTTLGPAGLPTDAVVRLRGTLSPSDRAGRAAVRLSVRGPASVTADPRTAHTWAERVRAGARSVAAPLPPDVRGLLPAVTVGDTRAVPEDLVAAMRTAGLTHVTAVSGAHFAIVGALVLALAGALRAPLVVRAAAVAVAGGLMLLVVGPQPSVVRAAVMGGVGLLGLVVGRRSVGPAALATAVVVLLVADPWLAVDVGFGLSVAATAGLVLLARPLVERLAPLCGRDAAGLLAAPVAAQVGCLPVALAVWPTFGPWAVLANLAVVPAIAPATVLGLLAALVATVWPPGGAALAAVAGAACWWVAAVARWVARLPAAGLAWWPGPVGAASAVLVVVAVAALVRPRHG